MDNTREKLAAPFPADAVEWRVSRAMSTTKGNKAIVLCYITARAVMDRLDDVFGWDRWQDRYEFVGTGVLCHLSVLPEGQSVWITKSDGASQTHVEPFKGGISDALKRAACRYGVGRYLYQLDESWVDITSEKQTQNDVYIYQAADEKKKRKEIKGFWTPPKLPAWALPETGKKPSKKKAVEKEPSLTVYTYDFNSAPHELANWVAEKLLPNTDHVEIDAGIYEFVDRLPAKLDVFLVD